MKHFGRENEGQCRSTCKHVASPHFSGMQVLGTEWRRHIPLFPGCLMEGAGGPSIEQLGIASSPSFWWRPELSACGVVFPVPGPGAPGALAEPRPPLPPHTGRLPLSAVVCFPFQHLVDPLWIAFKDQLLWVLLKRFINAHLSRQG